MDSDSEDEAEVVLEYVGGRDAAGRYHGRATVRYASGDVFRGRFAHGERLGRGATEFEDGSVQSGRYVGDALEGEALYAYPSGESIACNYRMGVMEGPYEEREACGRVCCAGTMVDGQRSGRVEFSYRDGGRLRGTVAEDGSVSGSDFVYSYPDGSCLAGEWRDGEMASAVFRSRSAAMMLGSDAGLPSAKRARTAPPTFSHDPGTATRISRQPMLADPFESLRVEARASRLPNAGEGLFARRALAEGEVAAFYAGVRLSHEVVDGRGWEENDNTLSIVSCHDRRHLGCILLKMPAISLRTGRRHRHRRAAALRQHYQIPRHARPQGQPLLCTQRAVRALQPPALRRDQVHPDDAAGPGGRGGHSAL
eukprot:COSAG04_NODE_251_length_18828_cov_18.990923_13_plen_367_part_00